MILASNRQMVTKSQNHGQKHISAPSVLLGPLLSQSYPKFLRARTDRPYVRGAPGPGGAPLATALASSTAGLRGKEKGDPFRGSPFLLSLNPASELARARITR